MVPLGRRVVEIDHPATLERVLARSRAMSGWHVRRLDLRPYSSALRTVDPAGALLLGCTIDAELAAHFARGGALVLPDITGEIVDEYRASVYRPDELYAGLREGGYAATPDARLYGWAHSRSEFTADAAMVAARALHDASIDLALTAEIAAIGRPVVGVMGGHAARRGSEAFRRAVQLGWLLARAGHTVATGGGPGAMEAANLGAYLGPYDAGALDAACAILADIPLYTPSVEGWAGSAFGVRRHWPDGGPSLGVPTWHYGHEPSNAFASGIAKFFQNSVREATLLQRCDAGIIFLPGAAGTVQEVFQDACENYYAGEGLAAPMVLVDVEHWTRTLPVHPLLQRLAERGGFVDAVHLVDDVESAVTLITGAAPSSPTPAVAEPTRDRT